MSVLFDIQGIQSRAHGDRGIARYLLELAGEFTHSQPDVVSRFVVSRRFAIPESVKPLTKEWPLIYTDRLRAPAERIYHIGSPVEPVSLDELWPQPARGLRLVVTLYDLIPYLFPEIYLQDRTIRRKYNLRLDLIRRADKILAISETTARDAIQHLGVAPEKVANVGAGVANRFRRPSSRSAALGELQRSLSWVEPGFLLYTGGIEPRKNIDGLLQAYAGLPAELRARHQLIVVCRVLPAERAKLDQQLGELGISDRVRFPGYVTEAQLIHLYQATELFVFPSFYEGFGLPIAEAIACGAAAIASDSPALVELIHHPEARFDAHDPRSIGETIERCLGDSELLQRLREVSLDPRYTWSAVAARTAAAYEEVLQLPPRPRPHRRPRIAYVTPLPPQRSGVADESYRLIAELAKHCEVDAFVDGPVTAEAKSPDGINVKGIRRFKRADRLHGGYDTVFYALGNSEFHGGALTLLRQRPGVVIAHDVRLNNLYAWLANGHPEVEPRPFRRILRSMYGDRLPDDLGQEGWIALEDADRHGIFMAREAIEDADHYLVHSHHAAGLARREADPEDTAKIAVIPFGMLDPEEFEPRPRDSEEAIVGTYGLVSPAKQVSKVVEAFARVVPRMEARLVIAGAPTPPSESERLAQLAARLGIDEQLHQTGELEQESELNAWIAGATVAVQLRSWTNGESSAAVTRCLAAGIPTIVTNLGSSAELPDECVVKVSRDITPQALGEVIADLLDDPVRRSAMKKAAVAYARANSYRHVAEHLCENVVLASDQ